MAAPAATSRLDIVDRSASRWISRPIGLASIGCLLLSLLGVGASPPIARAANDVTFTVNTTADSATGLAGACVTPSPDCALRVAIGLADGEPAGTDVTIVLGATPPTYDLNSSLGALQVKPPSGVSLTITGPAGSTPTISGQSLTRVFDVFGPGTATITGVTVSGGGDVTRGAGLSLHGGVTPATLTLSNVTVSGNQVGNPPYTYGQTNQGGGVYVDSGASLTMVGSNVTGNTARGGDGDIGGGPGGDGDGGGIYVTTLGTLTATNTTVSGNQALGGPVISSGPDENGGSAHGGGIDSAGALTLTGVTVSNNSATGEVAGQGEGGPARIDGGSATGGGIDDAGTLTMTRSAVTGNSIVAGNGGGGAPDGNGGAADGGGLDVEPAAAAPSLSALTFSGNTAIAGDGSPNSDVPGKGGAANGGGIDLGNAGGTLTNLTLSGNSVTGGRGGQKTGTGTGGSGGDAIGGDLAMSGTATLVNLTIANGAATGGVGGSSSTPGSAGAADGGGIGVAGGTLSVGNSIIASNGTGGNCVAASGTITSLGHNLENDTSCPFSQSGDQENVSSLGLGAIANNGGPTQTMSLLTIYPANPAIDRGGSSANGCPATDQRGVFRPQGQACDVGAYEYVFSPVVTAVSPSQGPLTGGYSVTITGANFVPGATVTFGGDPASDTVVANATTITASVPAATSAGAVNVTVSDPSGSSGFGDSSGQPGTLPNGFAYLAPPPTFTPTPTRTPTVTATPSPIPPTSTPPVERLYLPLVRNSAATGGT
ncbi:MAG: choice-of-anchor Q domain-containing protein [Candidatus Dormibacteraceae bacterium]